MKPNARISMLSSLTDQLKKYRILVLLVVLLTSCSEDNSLAPVNNTGYNANNVANVAYDWSFLTSKKYRYAGVAIEEAQKRFLFYCGNIDREDRPVITDHIITRIGTLRNGLWHYGEEKEAIWPGEEGDWDGLHVCDPTVIGGEFWYQGPEQSEKQKFDYALFYLGIAHGTYFGPDRDIINQIGWAVAKSLEGPWYKVVNDAPLVTSDAIGQWGVGQPSVVSIDQKGEVLLLYTRGEIKTATYSQRINLSDANNPLLFGESELPTTGLTQYDGTPDPLNHGGAFIYDDWKDRFYIIRFGHPNPSGCPNFISRFLQIASISRASLETGTGEWTVLRNLESTDGLPPRIFDGGWVRNKYGGLLDPENLEALVSTSNAGGACPDEWLYSYRIQGYTIPLKG